MSDLPTIRERCIEAGYQLNWNEQCLAAIADCAGVRLTPILRRIAALRCCYRILEARLKAVPDCRNCGCVGGGRLACPGSPV